MNFVVIVFNRHAGHDGDDGDDDDDDTVLLFGLTHSIYRICYKLNSPTLVITITIGEVKAWANCGVLK